MITSANKKSLPKWHYFANVDKNDEKVREGIVEYINNISQDNQIRKAVLSDLLENPQKIQLEQELKAKTLKFTEGFFVLSLSKREVDEGN